MTNHFACPEAAWLLLLPFVIYFLLPAVKKSYGEALKVPFLADIQQIKTLSGRGLILKPQVISFLRLTVLVLVWCCLVLALCRPQWVGKPIPVKNEGRDILLVVDISNSMSEEDFEYKKRMYSRLTAVKNVVNDFIDKRAADRMGLVLFGTRAYLQTPLTYDKQSLKEMLWAAEAGMAGNSTSIGDAVGVALKSLAESAGKLENKVIILLTDGENNDGSLSLPEAISLAKEEGVKIYTIGAGSDKEVFFGGLFSIPVDKGLDEKSLKALAKETKGNYFRAKDVNSLMQIYDKIDKLEPRTADGRYVQEVKELYPYPAGAALVLLLLLFLLSRKVK
ncbi:MAG TPA: BatB protein [Alphaproteobacteria bacterium]|nr:BatB protein [Alphaproteobacteria bacterium]